MRRWNHPCGFGAVQPLNASLAAGELGDHSRRVFHQDHLALPPGDGCVGPTLRCIEFDVGPPANLVTLYLSGARNKGHCAENLSLSTVVPAVIVKGTGFSVKDSIHFVWCGRSGKILTGGSLPFLRLVGNRSGEPPNLLVNFVVSAQFIQRLAFTLMWQSSTPRSVVLGNAHFAVRFELI